MPRPGSLSPGRELVALPSEESANVGGSMAAEAGEAAFRGARDGVFQLGTAVKNYASLAERLGGRRDTTALRAKIKAENAAVVELSRDTFAKIVGLNQGGRAASDARQQQIEALTRTYQDTLARFKDVSAECEDRERRFEPKPDPAHVPGETGAQGGAAAEEAQVARQQQQQQMEYEVDYNEALIAERDAGIQEIHQSILEVGDMMQDVAALVGEQGEQLGNVEEQMTRVANDVERGVGALRAADRKQRACTRRLGCASIVVFIIVAVTVLTVIHMVLG